MFVIADNLGNIHTTPYKHRHELSDMCADYNKKALEVSKVVSEVITYSIVPVKAIKVDNSWYIELNAVKSLK